MLLCASVDRDAYFEIYMLISVMSASWAGSNNVR